MKFVRLTTKRGMFLYINLEACVDIHWNEEEELTYITALIHGAEECYGVQEKPETFLHGLYDIPCDNITVN